MKNITRSWLIVILMIIISLIAYYLYNYSNRTTQTQQINNITIGWIGPLTGNTEWLGKDGLKTIQLVIEEYNKKKKPSDPFIHLIAADSPLESTNIQRIYHQMVDIEKAKILFVISSDDTIALANKILKDHVLIINPLNNDSTLANLNANIFLIAKTTESLSSIIADRMLSLNQKKAFVIYSTSERFTQTLAKVFVGDFIAAGGIAYMQPYESLYIKDFKPFLKKGLDKNVDAFFFIGRSEMSIAIQQAKAMGIKQGLYSTDYINNPTTIAEANNAIEGLQFSDFTYQDGNALIAKVFLNNFENNYHIKPHIEWTALQAHDAIQIVLLAIQSALRKPGDFIENVRKALLNVRDFEGVTGSITIRSDGTTEGMYPSIYMFKSGKAIKLKDMTTQ